MALMTTPASISMGRVLGGTYRVVGSACFVVLLNGCALFDPDVSLPDVTNDTNPRTPGSNDDGAFTPPDVNTEGKTQPPNPNTLVLANPTGCEGEGERFSAERRRCYRFVSQPALSWADAAIDCSLWSAGRGNLVSITSREEDEFVRTYSRGSLWIGASDAKREGEWRWLSKEVWFFENFEVGRPDNIGGVEHCLSKQESGLWNDLSCDVKLPYVCERAFQ